MVATWIASRFVSPWVLVRSWATSAMCRVAGRMEMNGLRKYARISLLSSSRKASSSVIRLTSVMTRADVTMMSWPLCAFFVSASQASRRAWFAFCNNSMNRQESKPPASVIAEPPDVLFRTESVRDVDRLHGLRLRQLVHPGHDFKRLHLDGPGDVVAVVDRAVDGDAHPSPE